MSLPVVHTLSSLMKELAAFRPDCEGKNEHWRVDFDNGVSVSLAHGQFRIHKNGELIETATPKTAVATLSKHV